MSFGMIMDLLIMACGVYMIYWAVQMKSSNKIPEMLVGKGFPITRAKDPKGFIKYTFPYTMGTGVLIFIAGTISALQILVLYPIADLIVRVIAIAAVFIYGTVLMKAQKKYLVGNSEK